MIDWECWFLFQEKDEEDDNENKGELVPKDERLDQSISNMNMLNINKIKIHSVKLSQLEIWSLQISTFQRNSSSKLQASYFELYK
jgi:hypothetical protein